jgi:hypothetical protein
MSNIRFAVLSGMIDQVSLTLLYCEGGAPLSSTADTFVVSGNDEVKIGVDCLQVHDEMVLVRDEKAVCCLHVCYVRLEGFEELVAEEALLLIEDEFLSRGFDGAACAVGGG